MIEQLDKEELLALLHKRCTGCGVVKYFGEFGKNGSCAGGVRSQCRECMKEYQRKWHQENKESQNERSRKWKQENKDKSKEYYSKWYQKNKERKREWDRKRHQKNKESQNERSRRWHRENRERSRENNRQKRARKLDAPGSHTADQVKARFDYYGNRCVYCGSSDNLQIEHRIPLSRGGSDWASNLAPACKTCNCSKGTKTETEYKELLRERKR